MAALENGMDDALEQTIGSDRHGLLFLSQSEVRALLDLEALFGALERAFLDLSAGGTSVPPRVAAIAPSGMLGAMPGYVPGTALEAKLITVFPSNHERAMPSHQGLIALFDERTGEPLAIMDAVHITAIRTGAASAVAARHVARPGSRTLAILGAGTQGRSHLVAFSKAFQLEEIRVASRDVEHGAALADLHPAARAVESFEEAVRGADIVCCCTDAKQPVIDLAWLSPGAHVGSVGVGRELDPSTIAAGSIFVEWRGAAANPPPAGAVELQHVAVEAVTEIGEVLGGARPGRRSSEEITVYKSTGHAVEDAAAARLVYDKAKQLGAGQVLRL